MRIIKAGQAELDGQGLEELAIINSFAKTQLKAEEVYIFSVLLCDNEVDRDFERFSERTLEELAELFVGATGICDHEWKTGNQVARIYRTELLTEPGRLTKAGTPYSYLKGHAYMLRTGENEGLIAEIEGGIKKETSVGCSVSRCVCSVCGEEMKSGCGHVRGQEYDGKLCYGELLGAVDAYEWSFVAVPAQKNAGVMKKFEGGLQKFVEMPEGLGFSEEYLKLNKEAALGRRYMEGLRKEVLRLGLLWDKNFHEGLKAAVDGMDEKALGALRTSLEERLGEKLPLRTQLPGRDAVTAFDGSDYLI